MTRLLVSAASWFSDVKHGLLRLEVLCDRLVSLSLGREKSALLGFCKGRWTPSLPPPCKTLCKLLVSHSANTAFFPGLTVPRRSASDDCLGLSRICHSIIFSLVPLLRVVTGPWAKRCFTVYFIPLNCSCIILPPTS